jgi:hypothetical protein
LTGALVGKMLTSRLDINQRALIRSGSIFVYLEDEGSNKKQKKSDNGEDEGARPVFKEGIKLGGIKRWTGINLFCF